MDNLPDLIPTDFTLNLSPDNVGALAQVLRSTRPGQGRALELHVTEEGVEMVDNTKRYVLGARQPDYFVEWQKAFAPVQFPNAQEKRFGLSSTYLAKLSTLWSEVPIAFAWNGAGFLVSTLRVATPKKNPLELTSARALLMPVRLV